MGRGWSRYDTHPTFCTQQATERFSFRFRGTGKRTNRRDESSLPPPRKLCQSPRDRLATDPQHYDEDARLSARARSEQPRLPSDPLCESPS